MDSKAVLDIFKKITTIPRESGHVEQMGAWLQRWALDHKLQCKWDKVGNILIVKEASKGRENIPAIVLQAHQDMVCEKNSGVKHDWSKDPINYIIQDGWMIAPDTTLGADDGIGIAAALALLEDDVPSGKIEALFTVDEETSMDGAEALKAGFFSGKTLINLDSEDEGQLFIGCAGGLNTNISFNYGTEPLKAGWKTIRLNISGGIGGHSGDDINKGRMNTLQQICRFLYEEWGRGMQLCHLQGGGKSNAIAREAQAVIAVPDPVATAERFVQFGKTVNTEFHITDPDVEFVAEECSFQGDPMRKSNASKIIPALFVCPHGAYAMSQDIKGLVQTSTNFASVRMDKPGVMEIVTSQRSPARSERLSMSDKVEAVFKLAGAKTKKVGEYPGWEPNTKSRILKETVASYRKLFGKKPEVKAIHAGLECGLFLTKFPDLDMISFGPTLRGVHAPGEKMELASLDKFVALLQDVVINFK